MSEKKELLPEAQGKPGGYDRFNPSMEEQGLLCLVTDVLVMLNPEKTKKDPIGVIRAVLSTCKGRRWLYNQSLAVVGISIGEKQLPSITLKNRMVRYNQAPERHWLYHVSCCPRCILILVSTGDNHMFGEGIMLPKVNQYHRIFEMIFLRTLIEKGDTYELIKVEKSEKAKQYLTQWSLSKNQWTMLKRYHGGSLQGKELEKKLRLGLDIVIKYFHHSLNRFKKSQLLRTEDGSIFQFKDTRLDSKDDGLLGSKARTLSINLDNEASNDNSVRGEPATDLKFEIVNSEKSYILRKPSSRCKKKFFIAGLGLKDLTDTKDHTSELQNKKQADATIESQGKKKDGSDVKSGLMNSSSRKNTARRKGTGFQKRLQHLPKPKRTNPARAAKKTW